MFVGESWYLLFDDTKENRKMLEEKGIVGPADGAKPREVYGDSAGRKTVADVELVPGGGIDESEESEESEEKITAEEEPEEEDWKKV